MNWDAIGAIGEILGAASVLVTLVYLAMQIRQNTAMMNTSVYESAMGGFISINQLSLGNPHVAEAYQKGLVDPGSLEGSEIIYCDMFIRAYMNHLYKLFRLYERGVFPLKEWRLAATEAKQLVLGNELGKQFAQNNRYFDELVSEIEKYESSAFSTAFIPIARSTPVS